MTNAPEHTGGAHHDFNQEYWAQVWEKDRSKEAGTMSTSPPNPYLAPEVEGLVPGTALDAGCGAGAEALWLASQGWQVTAADISHEALALAAERPASNEAHQRVNWIAADLSVWEPDQQFDLVTTHYAHLAMPQLKFYDRIAAWVAPGGTLLIVGHLHSAGASDHGHGHGHHGHSYKDHPDQKRVHQPPDSASVITSDITARLDPAEWTIVTADERQRSFPGPGEFQITLNDVIVRATRHG